jgi:hypothetical protein
MYIKVPTRQEVLTEFIAKTLDYLERSKVMPQPGTTWGDTDWPNPAVAYGYNTALEEFAQWVDKLDQ